MIDDERSVLISVRPRFANAIVSATKTVELRRTRMKVEAGTCFFIYSTSPVMAVIGTAVLDRVEADTPGRLWDRIKGSAEVTEAEYSAYFEGATEAVALHLSRAEMWESPVPLAHLRTIAGIEPNQSYRFLDPSQVEMIAEAAAS